MKQKFLFKVMDNDDYLKNYVNKLINSKNTKKTF